MKTILSDKIIESVVDNTNIYADIMINSLEVKERRSNRLRSDFQLWKPVTVNEMWVYVAVIMMMGIINKPNYKMFWTKDNIFTRLMRRDRLEQIRMMLHFTDATEEDPDDDLCKLSSFLDELLKNFQRVYNQEQNFAVDEYLSLWKGCLKLRVYIASKGEHYGVKIYMCCESNSGYLYNFIIYTGENKNYREPQNVVFPKIFEQYPNYTKVVLSLLDGLYNQGYCVTLDNLYTSPDLLMALFENDTDSFGTLRKKTGLPAES